MQLSEPVQRIPGRGPAVVDGAPLAEVAYPLAPRDLLSLERACVDGVRALEHVVQRLWAGSPERIASELGLVGGAEWAAFLLQSGGLGRGCNRCDLIRSGRGWELIEVNIGNAGGGSVTACADDYAGSAWRSAGDASRSLLAHLARLASRQAGGEAADRAPSIVLLVQDAPPGETAYGPASAATSGPQAGPGGVRVTTAHWGDLAIGSEGVAVGGSKVDLIFEVDVVDGPARMQAAYLASAAKLVLVPGPLSQIVNDKRLLAVISQEGVLLAEGLARTPWTRRVRRGPVDWRGVTADLEAALHAHRTELVLKRALSDSGRDVHVGWSHAPRSWSQLVEEALAQGDWIVQTWVEPSSPPLGGLAAGRRAPHLVWSGFVVEDRFAGGFARVLQRDGYDAGPDGGPMAATANGDGRVSVFPLLVSDEPSARRRPSPAGATSWI